MSGGYRGGAARLVSDLEWTKVTVRLTLELDYPLMSWA